MSIRPADNGPSAFNTGRSRREALPVSPDGQNALPGEYDIITIGGGINGSGIARDAAERGLRVLLLDKDDFGAATSAHNSRLIHGGLRYLENFEMSLVHESLQERELLLKNAPHLVKPLSLGIPAYSYAKLALYKTGMVMYDILSSRLLSFGKRKAQDPRMKNHRTLGPDAFRKAYPGVRAENLKGGVVYYDAQVNLPERICVENAVAARETGNATVLNHAEVSRIDLSAPVSTSNREASRVTFTDLLTGETYTATGKVVINAAGPWVDEIIRLSTPLAASPEKIARRIGGTKGSHIVVPRFPGGPEKAMYVEAKSDGRPFFILPWLGYYLIGTTDLHYKGDLDKVAADAPEVGYLLKETNYILPEAKLTESDVLYTYSGVRPLPYAGDKKAGKITRSHVIEDHSARGDAPGLLSIIGGKLTTYRNLAEEAVDYAVAHFNLKPQTAHSTTRDNPLPGGRGIRDIDAYKAQETMKAADLQIPVATVSHLIDLYGSRYREVLNLVRQDTTLATPLDDGTPDIAAQVVYAVRNEMAGTLADVMRRRLTLGFAPDSGLSAAPKVAALMAVELGWTPEQTRAEIDAYEKYVRSINLGFRVK